MAKLSLAWFGSGSANISDKPIQFRTRRAEALLMYLTTEAALHNGRPSRREALLGLLWPGYSEKSARQNLRTNLSYLRSALSCMEKKGEMAPFLTSDSQIVQVNLNANVVLDVDQFTQLLDEVAAHMHEAISCCSPCRQRLEQAVTLYGGDFLEGYYLPDGNEFETWVAARRELFRRQLLEGLENLTASYLAQADLKRAEASARRLIAIDPLRESGHRQLMTTLTTRGQRVAAVSQYETLRSILDEELGVEPSATTIRLYEAIVDGNMTLEDAGKTTAAILPVSGDGRKRNSRETGLTVPHNLPAQPTPLIGRQEELERLTAYLCDSKTRLITIIGPGGIGKTRLALETAALSTESFVDGVFFVDLAPLNDAEQIVARISDSINYRNPTGDDPRQALLDYLRYKQLLLVMDNFDHLLAGVYMVTNILQHAAQVKILSTSRQRLNLSSEVVYILSGLDYPVDPQSPAKEVSQFGAVQLLLDRARLVRPGLEIDSPALVQVSRICRSVQGMPLALVLAAGWLELLTFEEVAGEIAASLDILESQARDMPERQRSVRAAFDYSWRRLSTEDRQAFSRFAVFRGGFNRRAAHQVVGAGLRTLRTLVEKSLITAEGPDRYAVHELLRQFAEEKLEAAGQARSIRDVHSRYYLEAAAQLEADLKGRRQLEALEEIETDLDNVRAAWARALERRDDHAIDHALESLSLFFYLGSSSRFQEGFALFQQALQRLEVDQGQGDNSRRIWGRLTARSGLLQSRSAKSAPEIEGAIKTSLAIAKANVDRAEIAHSYLALGHYHSRLTGDHRQALNYFEQCLEGYQVLGDLYYVTHSLHRVGYSHFNATGLEKLNQYTRQSLQMARQIGARVDEAMALGNLGSGSVFAGDYANAECYLREAISLFQQMGSQGLAQTLIIEGLRQFLSGRLEESHKTAADGATIAKNIGYPLTQAFSLAVLSMLASLKNDYRLARRLADKSLTLISNKMGVFLGHWAQATASVGLGQTGKAWHQALSVLEISHHLHWYGSMTWPLPAMGIILARQGQPQRAVEILGLYFNHPLKPTGWAEKWSLLIESQKQMQEHLGINRYRMAWERGVGLDLVTAIEALLAERGEAS